MPPPSKRRPALSLSPERPLKKLKNVYGSPHTSERQGSEISFKNGAIVKVELKDFMTHQKFEMEPNPKINILSGVNGSGKSSILLGISVGLGAKAKSTHRSTKLSEYIREGQTKAVTKIHLYNGDEGTAHDKDVYGNRIVIQREISKGSTKLEIRDIFGRVIKSGENARPELDHILSKFHIDVENSVIIMHQEEAKSFFQHAEPNKLFNFYMKGTLLQKIKQKGLESNQHIKSINDSVVQSKQDIAEMEEKQKRWEEAIKVLDMERNDKSQNAARHEWAKYHSQMIPAMINAQHEYEAKKKEHDKDEESVKSKEKGQEAKEEELEKMNIEFKHFEDQVRNLDNEYKTTREKRDKLAKDLDKLKEEHATAEQDVKNHHSTIQTLKNEIRKSKLDANKNQAEDHGEDNQNESEMNRLEDQRKALDEKAEELRTKSSELGKQRDEYEKESERIDRESNKQKNSLESLKGRMNNLRDYQQQMNNRQSNNTLKRFGHNFVSLCNDIDAEAHQFSSKPIGPIGQYIRVNEESAGDTTLCTLIETQIGKRTLESFMVTNKEDMKKLIALMDRHFPGRNPNIIIRNLTGYRFDISRGRVPKECNVQTVLDHLTFQNDEVFNCVVDSCKIEKTLVTTDNKAQELFRNRNTVPPNTNSAITRTFNRYNPPTKGNYASYYITNPGHGNKNLLISMHNLTQQMETDQSSMKEEMRSLENKLRDFDAEKRKHNMEKSKVVEEIEKYKNKIQELMTKKTMIMSELSKLRQEKNDKKQSIQSLEEHLKMHERKLTTQTQLRKQKAKEKLEVKAALEEISEEKLKLYQSNRQSLCVSRDKLKEKIDSERITLRGLHSNLLKEKKDLARTKKKLDDCKANLESAKTKAIECEEKALRLSNGVKVKAEEVPSSKKEFEAQLKMQRQRAEKLKKELGKDDAELVEATNKLVNDINKLKIDTIQNAEYSVRLFEHAKKKSDTLEKWKEAIVRSLKQDFRCALNKSGIMRAQLDVDYEDENLTISVSSSNTDQKVALSSLSGGEKSKVLGCLLKALWDHVQCPFRGVDEWDVFLDHQARADMEKLMLENVKFDEHQYFFISPQESTLLTATWIRDNRDWAKVITLEKNQ